MATRDGIPNLTQDEVITGLIEAGCEDVSPYAELLQSSIWLRVDKTCEPGLLESRFGGAAMMPGGFEWPMYTAEPYLGRDPNDDPKTFVLWYAKRQKLPMFLIAQLNLAELPMESALPREGLLSFFTDPFDGVWGDSKSDQAGVRLTYFPPEEFSSLQPFEKPEPVDHRGAFAGRKWPQTRIEYFLKWSFSDWEAVHRLIEREIEADHRPELKQRISEWMQAISGYSFGCFLLDGGRNHQSDPRRNAQRIWNPPAQVPEGYTIEQLVAHEKECDRRAAAEWTVLLSITNDDILRPVVSDTGGLSFLIRKSDLAQLRFDRPWIVRS